MKDIVFVPYSSSKYEGLNGILVSCGSRTSLKIWELKSETFVPYHEYVGHGDESAVSNTNLKNTSCCLLHEIFNPEMNPKQLKLRTGEFIDDMRYLCCDVIELSNVFTLQEHDSEVLNTLCCVTACSDGIVR